MKAAVIHDWLTGMRGGEAVLESILDIFPDADIFTLVCDRDAVSEKIRKHKIHTSFLQKIPGVFKSYRNFLPLFPAAIESFNLKDYDLIISSSHCVAKSVKHNKSIKNFCYCHTPMRYAWDQFDNYFSREKNGALKFALISAIMPHLRRWDAKTSGRVSRYIANSNHVKKRIEKYYNAPAEVIYPPVDTNYYTVNHSQKREDFYLAVSALTEYKKIDFLVDAFLKMPKEHLVVIGTGPMLAQLEKKAQGNKNIHFLGKVPRDIIRDA
ncbi:MAG TPA: glycosyltransferase, partial [Candidatus Goldiibacteriota bacterium]|nr:glycosyltransferase [Candidatus Goldiibacteriota bacterium]